MPERKSSTRRERPPPLHTQILEGEIHTKQQGGQTSRHTNHRTHTRHSQGLPRIPSSPRTPPLLALPTFLPDLPPRITRRLTKFAKRKFEQLTIWKDFAAIAILWLISHQGLNVHAQIPDSPVANCMIHSITIIALSLVALVLNVATIVWREGLGKRLPTAAELAYHLWNIAIGILMSASAGTYAWHSGTLFQDVCSSLRNPIAGIAMLLGDINGLLSLLRGVLLAFHRPFSACGRRLTGYMSSIILLAVATTLQLTLIDRVITPAVNEAVRKGEENGEPLAWLQDLLFPNSTASAS